MTEFEFKPEHLEQFRETFTDNLDTLFEPTTTGQEGSFPVDTFTLGQTSNTIAELSPEQKTIIRKELYQLIGIPFTEPTEPITTYTLPSNDPGKNDVTVKVFAGTYKKIDPDAPKSVFLHQLHYGTSDGEIGWVVSASPEPPGELIGTGEGDKSDPNEPVFEDPNPPRKETPTSKEYVLAVALSLQKAFPDYSKVLDTLYKSKHKKVYLYQEPNTDGKRRAIQIGASPTTYSYLLGSLDLTDEKNPLFTRENLPRIVETKIASRIQLDLPQNTWSFAEEDTEKRDKSFAEMVAVLSLLREHNAF